MDLGASKRAFGYDGGAAILYMCGIILAAFVVIVGGLVLMVDSQKRGDDSAATFVARLLCFVSLLVVGFFIWLLRTLRTDRISVFTVYDNGLVFGTVADPFTMRLAVAQRAVVAWADIAELREHGPRSRLLRVLLPPGGATGSTSSRATANGWRSPEPSRTPPSSPP